MEISSDFVDLLRALNDAGAEYLIVGAHALNYHARPRATLDFDVWVNPTAKNALRVYRALAAFGAPLHDLRIEELTSDDLIFQIGVAPIRIDVITDISGVRFADAWPNRVGGLLGGASAQFLGRGDLIANKRASGRPKDLADLDRLERDV